MSTAFLVGERLAVRLDASDPAVVRYLCAEMDPYRPAQTPSPQPDAVIEAADPAFAPRFRDVQNPANDGRVTAIDEEDDIYLVHGEGWCRVRLSASVSPALLTYSPGFPLGRVYGPLLRPALHGRLLDHDAAAVHSATVELDGSGVAIAGWSESGKTETALALMEQGARFLSDKWTILGSDRTLATFPIGVGVRRWVLPYLPRLRAALPGAARAQLGVAGVAAQLSRPVQALRSRGRVGDLAGTTAARAVALADRAALSPSQLIAAYGQEAGWEPRARLEVLVLLTTVARAEPSARERDPAWVAPRLARTAAFERRGLFELGERTRYAGVEATGLDAQGAVEREDRFLRDALAGVKVLQVEAPFPTDPRRVADAIASHL